MTRADDADRELDEQYAQVPDAGCKGFCWDACGPIDAGLRERVRMTRAGVRLPSLEDARRKAARSLDDYRCPALTDDNRCGVYDVRPMVCRIWGVSELLPCPHGCRPDRYLTHAEAMTLLDHANKAGTCERRTTVAEWERAFADREVLRKVRAWVPMPDLPPRRR